MKRIPVLLDNDTYEQLRKLAFDTYTSMAEHIRKAIKNYLQENLQKTN